MTDMKLRIHRFLPFTEVEGPGKRACIWVQGCPIHCPGCAVPFTWSAQGGEETTVDELEQRILQVPEIEGVTFVGGEPFEQAEALAELGRRLKKAGLSITAFTGYLLEDLRTSEKPGVQDLLAITDLLLDGPFKQELRDMSRPWVGSKNQRFHFLTERYRHLEAELTNIPNRLEVFLHPDGRIEVNGMAPMEDIHQLLEDLLADQRAVATKEGDV